ncbi:MAG: glycosyltransferase family 2 protein [Bacteroidota bacterium]|nr:glycosyltransferase family 2 protein [Bacteroidota bacterium]
MKTAIVILNWNTRNHLETFLPFLTKYSQGTDVEIWMADNASTDDSVSFVSAHYPGIKLLQLDKNYGFAEGYNRALQQIEAKYYILLNSDIEVTENWVNPLINLLENNSSIAACMPKLRSYYNRDYFEYAGAAGGFIDKLGYPFCKGRIFDTIEKDEGQYDGTNEVFWATGACMAVKADIFHRIGGFYAYFFAHQEEIDFCWRLQNSGLKVYCTSDSVVYHLGGGTLPKSNPHKTFLNFRNNHVLLYRNLPRKKWLKLLPIRLILDGIAALVFLTGSQPLELWAVLKAHFVFYNYLLKYRVPLLPSKLKLSLIYHKSILYQYYILKKKKFSDL